MTRRDCERVDVLVHGRISLQKAQTLFAPGDPVDAIYAIRVGTLKTQVTTRDGRVQIVGFHMPGELVGLDALVSARQVVQAVALEDARLCRISVPALHTLAIHFPALHNNILRLLSEVVHEDHRLLTILGVLSADERVVAFLLDLSGRLSARGFSAHEFRLRMTREEIGSYLGLKLETISRSFARLTEMGLVCIQHRNVKLLDMPALREIYSRALAQEPAGAASLPPAEAVDMANVADAGPKASA